MNYCEAGSGQSDVFIIKIITLDASLTDPSGDRSSELWTLAFPAYVVEVAPVAKLLGFLVVAGDVF